MATKARVRNLTQERIIDLRVMAHIGMTLNELCARFAYEWTGAANHITLMIEQMRNTGHAGKTLNEICAHFDYEWGDIATRIILRDAIEGRKNFSKYDSLCAPCKVVSVPVYEPHPVLSFTPEQVKLGRELAHQDKSIAEIFERLNISYDYEKVKVACNMLKGESYRHLNNDFPPVTKIKRSRYKNTLPDEKRQAIKEASRAGRTLSQLSAQFDLSTGYISLILNDKR